MVTYGAFTLKNQQRINHIGIEENDRLFSYLPLAPYHWAGLYCCSSIIGGVQTAFPESLDTFIEDVKMHRPTLFISVPRLWTLFQQRIQDKLPQKS